MALRYLHDSIFFLEYCLSITISTYYNIGILLKLYNILSFPIGIDRYAEIIIIGC